MKNSFIIAVILGLIMLALPLPVLKTDGKADKTTLSASALAAPPVKEAYASFNIKITESGEIGKIAADDYIIGVVSAEMPAAYSTEALKAQAVAAYTFACYRKAGSTDDFDLTDNPETDQCYISKEKAYEKWGESADEYYSKISAAVKEVSGLMLSFKGDIALACYHAMSSGVTESCKDVWGSDLPYLTSVTSIGDKLNESYMVTKELSTDEVKNALSGFKTAEGEHSAWFSDIQKSETGRVTEIKFCGTALTGAEVSKALSLRSSNFEVSATEGGFSFKTLGYGHGVGMSQTGAEYMAKQGSSYKEILAHYYPGCELVREVSSGK